MNEDNKNLQKLCENIKCDFPGAYCALDDENIPKCMCDQVDCESDRVQVCGYDGQTYASKCDLMKFSCAKQTNIEIAYEGQCSQGLNCLNKIYFVKIFWTFMNLKLF